MKIDSSAIGMESARSYRASKVTVRRFSITEYQGNLTNNGNMLDAAIQDSDAGTDEQNEQTAKEQDKVAANDWQNRFGVASSRINMRSASSTAFNSIRQMTMRYIFNLLFGHKRYGFQDWMQENGWSNGGGAASGAAGQGITGIGVNYKVLSYTEESFQMEAEDTFFSTTGTVHTADGREINFNINVGMSRRFEEYYRADMQLESYTMCDPLVINLDTDIAELSDQTFYFDIDADGELDEISGLSSASGYLALDKNGDGVINDGSELFGTSSGNGFADLAKYDDDGNGWIDENDAIWSKLKIWTKDENGNDVLYRLSDKGVGAICLQNVSTDFTLQSGLGQTQGAIRSTGIFLYEDGNVGTVQHVDVAKYSGQA
ncbi:MAG: hypothetical protein J1E64_05615 [Acetatifactor sp.]|nr:hypothetical protein [Acetatifactor sp.]